MNIQEVGICMFSIASDFSACLCLLCLFAAVLYFLYLSVYDMDSMGCQTCRH